MSEIGTSKQNGKDTNAFDREQKLKMENVEPNNGGPHP